MAEGIDWKAARAHWSFQAPRAQALPEVKEASWPQQRIDHFVLAKLEAESLSPSPEADRRAWIRRVFFDLTGLPPVPAEVEAFLNDLRPDAHERLVDDLLGRRAFGERLASVWMNLARYGEDQAHQVGGNTSLNYPNAHLYREWVIQAFNEDLPYNEFVRKQLAIDLMEPGNNADLAALGFLGLGHKLYSRSRLDVQAEEWSEKVDTVSQAFLGLTVACARCHDHKFDPITMRDYYAMAGVFASIEMVNRKPDGKAEDGKTKAEEMDPATLHIVKESEPKNLPIYDRGDVESPGTEVPRGYLQVLSRGKPVMFKQGSGRAELADEIANPANPLTARVMVNRIWDVIFGKPLVTTSSNFGATGNPPSHPELLDDLAVRFVEGGWSVKKLVRELVLSATYRQSSRGSLANEQLDEANVNLWRMERKRLSIEQFRDAVLAAAGTLIREGGRSIDVDDPGQSKRTVYSKVSRRELNKTLMLFDYPDANVHAERRSSSTTPTQKLFVMNSPFMLAQSKALAQRLSAMPVKSESERVVAAFELLYARQPMEHEVDFCLEYLKETGGKWVRLAQALMATNEMLYVD